MHTPSAANTEENVVVRGSRRPWLRGFCSRLLTVLLLAFGTEGVAEAVTVLASAITEEADCCDDDCDADDEQGCSECGHCVCCAHVSAFAVVLPSPTLMLGRLVPTLVAFGGYDERPYGSGYRAPPFRPPLG